MGDAAEDVAAEIAGTKQMEAARLVEPEWWNELQGATGGAKAAIAAKPRRSPPLTAGKLRPQKSA